MAPAINNNLQNLEVRDAIVPMDITKVYRSCNVTKPGDQYYKQSASKDGLQNNCKDCARTISREHHRKSRARLATRSKVAVTTKCCGRCKTAKDIDQFYKQSSSIDGRAAYCKDCSRESLAEYRSANRERVNEYQRQWRVANPDKTSEYTKRYREAHPERIKTQVKERRRRNKDKLNDYSRRRYAINPQFKMSLRLRNRLNKAIQAQLTKGVDNCRGRPASAVRDLGCTIPQLLTWLEAKWQPGMSWDNYGDWHIDHVKPLAGYDLTDSEQCKQACHYTNLQPLWATENLRKGAQDPDPDSGG